MRTCFYQAEMKLKGKSWFKVEVEVDVVLNIRWVCVTTSTYLYSSLKLLCPRAWTMYPGLLQAQSHTHSAFTKGFSVNGRIRTKVDSIQMSSWQVFCSTAQWYAYTIHIACTSSENMWQQMLLVISGLCLVEGHWTFIYLTTFCQSLEVATVSKLLQMAMLWPHLGAQQTTGNPPFSACPRFW